MFNVRSILGLILFVQSGLFAADSSPAFNEHFDGWEALLVQLFNQKSLQPHLEHGGAYSLKRVNKKLCGLISGLRTSYIDQRASLIEKNPDEYQVKKSLVALHDGSFVVAESIIWDASGKKAYAILKKEPVLCCFSWPSRELIYKKRLPVCDTCLWGLTCANAFFEYSIGFLWSHCEVSANDFDMHFIGYLPTGYMIHIKEKAKEGYHFDHFVTQDKCSTVKGGIIYLRNNISETGDFLSLAADDIETEIIFTTDASAVIKKPDGSVIPW